MNCATPMNLDDSENRKPNMSLFKDPMIATNKKLE